ncbi:MAG: hypothetical protein KBC22_03055 [Candidatus Pacebacteria bacterium]|nr:hypothetical protein [Candidatus Paceibacterota bacterium]
MEKIFMVIDAILIHSVRRISEPLARLSLFIVFFWFGILKVIGTSPAAGLVTALFNETFLAQFITAGTFLIILGIAEIVIGIFFVLPHFERVAILIMLLHMVTTFLPIVLLPDVVWQMPWTPTIEGQYIIKNVVMVALAIGIASHIRPWRK